MTKEILLNIHVERYPNRNYGATIEELVSGSSSDTGGESLPRLVINALRWAGVNDIEIPENASLDDIAQALSSEKAKAAYTDLKVTMFGEIWSV